MMTADELGLRGRIIGFVGPTVMKLSNLNHLKLSICAQGESPRTLKTWCIH